jgi:hypothetical protein
LSPYVDYTINGNLLTLNSGVIGPQDIVMVTNVTNSVVPESMEFRIFQDMRGVQATYRMTPATTTTLTESLNDTADIIHVANASALTIPDFASNIWGVITINGERIMYRDIDFSTNTISSLLRGTAGTSAASHDVQFQDYVESNSFLGDGTTNTFTTDIIVNGATTWASTPYPYDSTLFSTTGPNGEYDPGTASNSDAVEVYLGGELQTSGYAISDLDPVVISFITPPASGIEVTILVRKGHSWYNPGVDTASDGVPLQETNNPIALFLRGAN